MNHFKCKKYLLCAFVFLQFSSCSFFDSKITFYGTVYKGQLNQTTGQITIIGPLKDAVVKESSNSETAYTNSNGEFSLEITVPAKLGYAAPETYTVEASGYYGANEKISVQARPGDRAYVRDFILYQHEVETAGQGN